MGCIYKQAIRGILSIEVPWYYSVYKLAEAGEIEIKNRCINIRIGPLHYQINEIIELSIVYPGSSFIKIHYIENTMTKEIYVKDYRLFGLSSFFNGNRRLFEELKNYQKNNSSQESN